MCTSFSSYVFSVFSALFLIIFFFNGAVGGNLIQNTCRKSAKGDPNLSYDFCVTSLQAVPKSHNASLKGLGLISVKLAKTNASHTKSYIKKLSSSETLDKHDKLALKDCLELYSDTVDTLKDAIKDFKSKHYFEANFKVGSAMDASSTCEEGFKEKKGGVSPLTKKNNDMFQLTAIAMSIINMLRGLLITK